MSFEELKRLWNDFEDVPIDKDECIDEPFHVWCQGTDRYEIWHWFDDRLPNGLAKLFMREARKAKWPKTNSSKPIALCGICC